MSNDEKQLLQFCTASVELYARSIIDPANVNGEAIQKEIQSFASNLSKSQAANVGKILFCLELQYRNATLYQSYVETRKKIETALEDIGNATDAIRELSGQLPNQADIKRHQELNVDLQQQATMFLKYYSSCFPIRHRVRYAPTPMKISPICSYKTEEFEINAQREYFLLQKQQLLWKVQARDQNDTTVGVGPEMVVPSLFFFIHWLSDDAESMQRLFSRSRDSCSAYICAIVSSLRAALQKADVKSAFGAAQVRQLDSLLSPVLDDPDKITKPIVSGLKDALAALLQQLVANPSAKETLVASMLTALQAAVAAYLSIPESVPDRSKLVLNRNLRLDGQPKEQTNEHLVQVEWKMKLVLNKTLTTTETTQIIPNHVDMESRKVSEQEMERKMVIKSVVHPSTDKDIGLNEAIKLGIVDYSSGTYRNPDTGDSMTIDEAIMRGLIIVDFVAVNASEEKSNSFGVVIVEDPTTKQQVHYVVHEVTDKSTGQRLDFNTAIERKLLKMENGTYWDNVKNEALPIVEALEKDYLKGRKVVDPAELEKLTGGKH